VNNFVSQLKQKCCAHSIFTFFVFIILGINLVAHRPIQIINGVSFEDENNFTIHLSGIREFLEPIVG
jgi:hypothetical protein